MGLGALLNVNACQHFSFPLGLAICGGSAMPRRAHHAGTETRKWPSAWELCSCELGGLLIFRQSARRSSLAIAVWTVGRWQFMTPVRWWARGKYGAGISHCNTVKLAAPCGLFRSGGRYGAPRQAKFSALVHRFVLLAPCDTYLPAERTNILCLKIAKMG